MTSGYIPGSVWVPWSIARPERRRRRSQDRESWLRRLFPRRKLSLYQRCLAIHIMTTGDTEQVSRS